MLHANILRQKLASITGQDYAAYQSLLGNYLSKFQKIPTLPRILAYTVFKCSVMIHVLLI